MKKVFTGKLEWELDMYYISCLEHTNEITCILDELNGKFVKITIEEIDQASSTECKKCNRKFECLTK